MQKPFKIENIPVDDTKFCHTYYWKIFDESSPRHTYIEPNNLTVYFGRNFILRELNIVLASKAKEEFEFHFGSNSSKLVKLNVNNDCHLQSDLDGFRSFNCPLSSLGRIPIDLVTFFTDNISKMKIFSVPSKR
ncbi:unnamed protein product [Rodentolepis nana]|uniref:Uncharacterized protein n=1 Tax=Rodentolepis nana TaxID=102285 RepID=A0A0R3T1A4_RODNA|nr:unnamed protein product [Rodentolepis nana]